MKFLRASLLSLLLIVFGLWMLVVRAHIGWASAVAIVLVVTLMFALLWLQSRAEQLDFIFSQRRREERLAAIRAGAAPERPPDGPSPAT